MKISNLIQCPVPDRKCIFLIDEEINSKLVTLTNGVAVQIELLMMSFVTMFSEEKVRGIIYFDSL